MCGRFTIRAPASVLARQFGLVQLDAFEPRYNVAPSQLVPVVRAGAAGGRELVWLKWGLVPEWALDPAIGNRMINARAETAATKPAFRDAIEKRRCLVVADGFYEWEGGGRAKQPFFIHLKDNAPFAFAGLWDRWTKKGDPLESCTIVTTDANDVLRPLHDRMPVILPPDHYAQWLDAGPQDPKALEGLLKPFPSETLAIEPVSRYVNNATHEGAECIAPPDAPMLF